MTELKDWVLASELDKFDAARTSPNIQITDRSLAELQSSAGSLQAQVCFFFLFFATEEVQIPRNASEDQNSIRPPDMIQRLAGG